MSFGEAGIALAQVCSGFRAGPNHWRSLTRLKELNECVGASQGDEWFPYHDIRPSSP